MSKLYRIVDDFAVADRWYLQEPICGGEIVDARMFLKGKPVELPLGHCEIPIQQGTRALDFTLAAFDMPVVRSKVAELVLRVAGESSAQLVPASVDGRPGFAILNVLSVMDAIDVSRSELTRWGEGDGRPDKVGQLRMVTELRIDAGRVSGCQLFRPAEWKIALIVGENLKKALEGEGVSGIKFLDVS